MVPGGFMAYMLDDKLFWDAIYTSKVPRES